jgi:uncharacterized protein with HEPN domain
MPRDNHADSDTDIMIDIDPAAEATMSVYDYVGLKRYIASLFDGRVDVIDREALKPHVLPPRRGMRSMPSERSNPKAYLFHIRDNITLGRRFVDGFDYDRFRNNQLVFYAVTRTLEIISEASRRLPAAIKARYLEIPWADVAGAGNVYRHDYEDVRQRAVWNTVQKHLPPLLAGVEQELRQLGELPC